MDNVEFLEVFTNDLINLGVRPGHILMVHSALSSFRYVPGGATTIIQGLLNVLGKGGTLLMPALSWENVTKQNPFFDQFKTKSCVGIIAETFRLLPNVQRSIHPTHSVCSLGPMTDVLISSHILDNTPCGENSPFHQLAAKKGQILMLGCGLIYNTSIHAIEELVEPKYLFSQAITYKILFNNGNEILKDYIPHNFIGWKQKYDRVTKILTFPALVTGNIANTKSHLIDAAVLWEVALSVLQKNPLFFVEATHTN